MSKWAKSAVDRFVNAGTPLVLMGAMWLYLWVFPWYGAYLHDPRWGHNYAEALAFLAVGLAYFNRRLVSDVLALSAAVLIVPASLELLSPPVTAIVGAVLVAFLIIDMIVERGRKSDLGQPSNRRLAFWLKKHLLRFAEIMLLHLTLIYYLVRLPGGTYENELVTKVYDGMLIPFILLALLEGAVRALWGIPTSRLGFFFGMSTILVSLLLLVEDPAIWPILALTVAVSALGVAALVVSRMAAADPE